jgi:hypothetical protein
MRLKELTDRTAVLKAMKEYDELGSSTFLAKHGFRESSRYLVRGVAGKFYDSKAIAAVGHRYQFPDSVPLTSKDLRGGDEVTAVLQRMLFAIVPVESDRAVCFVDDEHGYKKWLKSHPNGFVVNTTRSARPTYLMLHKASCPTTTIRGPQTSEGAFTEHAYIKVCADTVEVLLAWTVAQGASGFSKVCTKCKPEYDPTQPIEQTSYDAALEAAVARSLADPQARKARLATRSGTLPERLQLVRTEYRRNQDVIAEVLERANGSCEVCRKPAPFLKRTDQTAYLEVHHRQRLADGGEDTVENAVAVCPNCHRRAHYG